MNFDKSSSLKSAICEDFSSYSMNTNEKLVCITDNILHNEELIDLVKQSICTITDSVAQLKLCIPFFGAFQFIEENDTFQNLFVQHINYLPKLSVEEKINYLFELSEYGLKQIIFCYGVTNRVYNVIGHSEAVSKVLQNERKRIENIDNTITKDMDERTFVMYYIANMAEQLYTCNEGKISVDRAIMLIRNILEGDNK